MHKDDQKNQKNEQKYNIDSNLNATLVTAKIIIFYLFIGFTWILTSDYLVNIIFTNPQQIIRIQSIKGAFYVAITAIIFYFNFWSTWIPGIRCFRCCYSYAYI